MVGLLPLMISVLKKIKLLIVECHQLVDKKMCHQLVDKIVL